MGKAHSMSESARRDHSRAGLGHALKLSHVTGMFGIVAPAGTAAREPRASRIPLRTGCDVGYMDVLHCNVKGLIGVNSELIDRHFFTPHWRPGIACHRIVCLAVSCKPMAPITFESVDSVGLPSRLKALYTASRLMPASRAIWLMPRARATTPRAYEISAVSPSSNAASI